MRKLFTKSKTPRSVRTVIKHYGGDILLIYRMMTEKASREEADIGDGIIYSISVTKISFKGEKREIAVIHDISRRAIDAKRIFDMTSRGLVTPSSAAEIISDIIGIYL